MTAASRNCPSPPRFQMPARKATIGPRQSAARVTSGLGLLQPAPAEQTPLQHIAVIGQGILAQDQQDQPAHDQRQDNGNQHAELPQLTQPLAAGRPGGEGPLDSAGRSCRFCSGHEQADLALHISAVLHDTGEATLKHHADPVADLQQLVEIG